MPDASRFAYAFPQITNVVAGMLLFCGLWTPVAGGLVALVALWRVLSTPGDPWMYILIAALGAGLAMIGPGAWSIDARLFGRKRIDIPDRYKGLHPPNDEAPAE